MKKTILLVAAAMLSFSALAQTPSPGLQPSMVTPTPAGGLAGGLGVNASQASTYHYRITYADIQGIGANTSGDLLLFTQETAQRAGAILQVWIAPTIRLRGGGLSAVTAQVKGANSYGTTQDVYTTTSTVPVNKYIYAQGDPVESVNQAINLHLISTGDNLNMATSGQIDVWITRVSLR